MPKKLTVYEAPDGRQFPSRAACAVYEMNQWRTDQLVQLLTANPYVGHHAADMARAVKDDWASIKAIMEHEPADG